MINSTNKNIKLDNMDYSDEIENWADYNIVTTGAACWLFKEICLNGCDDNLNQIIEHINSLHENMMLNDCLSPVQNDTIKRFAFPVSRIAFALSTLDSCQNSENLYYSILKCIPREIRFNALNNFYKVRTPIWDICEILDVYFSLQMQKEDILKSNKIEAIMMKHGWICDHFEEICKGKVSRKTKELSDPIFATIKSLINEIQIEDVYEVSYGAYLAYQSGDESDSTLVAISYLASILSR